MSKFNDPHHPLSECFLLTADTLVQNVMQKYSKPVQAKVVAPLDGEKLTAA